MRRVLIALALTVVALGTIVWFTEPPRLLSWADRIAGGGRGVSLVADDVAFGTAGQTLNVWAPSAKQSEPRPVLVFYHGGGWVHGDRRAYDFAARAFAARGFVVVVPDYRKVPGVRFPAFVQDGAQAVKWVRDTIARFGGDPRRIALAGHSAGAHTVAMLALDPRWLQAEGVDPGIVRAGIPMCGPYDFYPFRKKRAIDAMAGVRDPQFTQPLHFARADAPPLLLLSAGKDVQVGAHNAVNLAAKLKALGAPVRHRDYPQLTHEEVAMSLSRPYRGKAPVLEESVAFLNDALRSGGQAR
jgi:acetyl esterase/lipase